MTEEMENKLQKENEKLKSEISDLKSKLEQMNPSFSNHLQGKVNMKYKELCEALGEAIQMVNFGVDIQGMKMHFYSEGGRSYNGFKQTYHVDFEQNDKGIILKKLSENEMRNFQASLDNLSWALKEIQND